MAFIRKTFGPLSAGTKVNVLTRAKNPQNAVVQLATKPSAELLKQKHKLVKEMGTSGIFEIPLDLLVVRKGEK